MRDVAIVWISQQSGDGDDVAVATEHRSLIT